MYVCKSKDDYLHYDITYIQDLYDRSICCLLKDILRSNSILLYYFVFHISKQDNENL